MHPLKRSWRILAVLLLLASLPACADPWTSADTARQAIFTGLAVVDWAQTRRIARQPVYYEMNPVLGSHPSVGQVDAYFAGAIVGHAAVSYLLPAGWRAGWQYVWIGIEAQKTYHNRSIGLRFAF